MDRIGEALIANALFIALFAPTLASLIAGRFEALYLPPMAVAVGLIAFKRHSPQNLAVAPALLAVSTGIKLFPGIVMGFIVLGTVKEFLPWSGVRDSGSGSILAKNLRVLAGFALGIALLAGITVSLVPAP